MEECGFIDFVLILNMGCSLAPALRRSMQDVLHAKKRGNQDGLISPLLSFSWISGTDVHRLWILSICPGGVIDFCRIPRDF